jgi:hypothetical protein
MTPAARTTSQRSPHFFAVIVGIFPVFAACSSGARSDATPASAPSSVSRAEIVDVIYEQGTNDEGVLTLLGAPAVSESSAEPVVTEPLDQAVLSAPETFAYRVGASARRERERRGPERRALPDWLTLERSAFAHGTPMNGDAFLLVFSTPSDPKVLRVFTQARSYVPSADEWRRLVEQSGFVTLTITHAIFEQGRLTEDGGPFVGQSVRFTIVH